MPNINSTLTIGLELEATELISGATQIMQPWGFSTHFDSSVLNDIVAQKLATLPHNAPDLRGTTGAEVIAPPFEIGVRCSQDGGNLTIDYRSLKQMTFAMCQCAQRVNRSCGFHVHLGRPDKNNPGKSLWEPERVRTMLAIGLMLEDKLFAVCPPSRQNFRYCRRIGDLFSAADLRSFYPTGPVQATKANNVKRRCWLNIIETRRNDPVPSKQTIHNGPSTRTIETRMLGNTRRPEYVWAWVQLWCKVAAYVAYLPSSLAMMHCTQGSLAADFETLTLERMAKTDGRVKLHTAEEI